MDGAPTLSVCMIARDEAERLPVALRSVCGVASELIVVDTGSRDQTAEVARTHGARVVQTTWDDDFAKARNLALQNAASDWILCLDCDEQLAAGQEGELRQLLNAPVDAYFVRIRSPLAGIQAGQTFVHLFQRLFRNHPQIRFRGRVHEQVSASLEGMKARVAVADLEISHEGYRLEPEKQEAKLRRNLRLLHLDQVERPDDAYVRYHLGETTALLGDYQDAVGHYENALRLDGLPVDHVAAAHQNLASALLKLKQWESAIHHADESLRLIPSARTPLLVRASAHLRRGDLDTALADVDRYLAPAPDDRTEAIALFGLEMDCARALLIRGQCKLQLGDFPEAETNARRVLETRPDWAGGWRLLARVFEAQGQLGRAVETMRHAVELEHEHFEGWWSLARLQITTEDLEGALATTVEGLSHHDSPELFNLQGWILIRRGDLEGALQSFLNVLRLQPGSEQALKRIAGLYHKLGNLEQAQHFLRQIRGKNAAVEFSNSG